MEAPHLTILLIRKYCVYNHGNRQKSHMSYNFAAPEGSLRGRIGKSHEPQLWGSRFSTITLESVVEGLKVRYGTASSTVVAWCG